MRHLLHLGGFGSGFFEYRGSTHAPAQGRHGFKKVRALGFRVGGCMTSALTTGTSLERVEGSMGPAVAKSHDQCQL